MSSSAHHRDAKHKSKEQSSSPPAMDEVYYKAGLDYLAKHLDEYAVECFKRSDSQGSLEAKVALGDCYLHGVGVPQDDNLAFQSYRAAATQGNLDAKYRYAVCHQIGVGIAKDEKEALKWFKDAADHGHPRAQTAFAKHLQQTKNPRQAVRYLTKAANQDHPDAQFELGICYQKGIGVDANAKTAEEWLEKAKKQGHPGAITMLAKQHKDLTDEFEVVPEESFFEQGMVLVTSSMFSKDNKEKKQTTTPKNDATANEDERSARSRQDKGFG